MSRKSAKDGSAAKYRAMPARPAGGPSRALPSFSDEERFLYLVDLLLRRRIYVAAWAGSSGAVVFIDIQNGSDRRRYTATNQSELHDAVESLQQEFDDGSLYEG